MYHLNSTGRIGKIEAIILNNNNKDKNFVKDKEEFNETMCVYINK